MTGGALEGEKRKQNKRLAQFNMMVERICLRHRKYIHVVAFYCSTQKVFAPNLFFCKPLDIYISKSAFWEKIEFCIQSLFRDAKSGSMKKSEIIQYKSENLDLSD